MSSVKSVCIVSLSSGIIGEKSVAHELEIGLRRLESRGLKVRFSEHALRGTEYIRDHPEKRAQDLLWALRDPGTDMILSAIGGDDTYRLLPYLFGHNELEDAVRVCREQNPGKIFLGFSDTTINHLMFYKLGFPTFYGQAFLSDVCEIGPDMLPYSRRYFDELIETGTIREIVPSSVWYEERKSFSKDQIGTVPLSRENRGFELLQGSPVFSGEILGGCIDSIGELFETDRYEDMPLLARQYDLFPHPEEWEGKILLLESSEEMMKPEQYRRVLSILREYGIFERVSGVLVGKPMSEVYYEEYREILTQEIARADLPVVYNLNVGHAQPRCIIPFGKKARVDADAGRILFL